MVNFFNIIPLLFYILVGILTASSGLFFSFLLYLHYIHKSNEHLPGPPRSSFILGHLPAVREYQKNEGTIAEYFLNNRLQYGPVFVVFLVHQPLVILGDPAYVREVIVGYDEYAAKSKSGVFGYEKIGFIYGQRFLGTGLLSNVDNESWRKRRQLMNPAFHRKCLKNFMTDFNDVCSTFMVRMMDVVEEQQQVSMVKEFGNVTLDIISKVSFNINTGAVQNPDSPFQTAITSALRGAEVNISSILSSTLLSIYQFRFFQTAVQKEQIDAAKFLREFAFDCVTNRINDIKANKDVPNDLLSLLVNDKSLSMEDIIDEFVTVFFAGQDTTANSLAFALYEIARNQDIEAKILKELEDVLGSKHNVDFDDLANLKYLGQVLQESLRKYPVAGGPARVLKKEITIGGYKIMKGNSINCTKHLLNHNPEIWPNPEIFDPERFSEPEKIPQFNSVYFPFSLGPRNCIGQTFAKFESKVILARVLHQFHFQLLPGQTAKMEERIIITPRDGVMCKVMLRH